jgi:hypothetical protein
MRPVGGMAPAKVALRRAIAIAFAFAFDAADFVAQVSERRP